MNRWDIITEFIKKYKFKDYLEIGYYKGWSFDNVIYRNQWINMTAVDPNPCKNRDQEEMKYGESEEYERDYMDGATRWLTKMTSDDFFEEWNRSKKWLAENTEHKDARQFDIIFIDGLHEAFQVEKDIHNSLNHLKPGGIIVLHDCNPPKYQHTTTGIDGCWTGDTYKAFIRFKMKFPEYRTYVVDTDWGCGVIETPIMPGVWIDMRSEDVERMIEWDYFDRNRNLLLDIITVEEFKTKLNERTENNNSPA